MLKLSWFKEVGEWKIGSKLLEILEAHGTIRNVNGKRRKIYLELKMSMRLDDADTLTRFKISLTTFPLNWYRER